MAFNRGETTNVGMVNRKREMFNREGKVAGGAGATTVRALPLIGNRIRRKPRDF